MRGKWRAQRADGGAHAARGFVGGAAYQWLLYLCRKIKFQCRTRLCGWCSAGIAYLLFALSRFQCRTRLCGWCNDSGTYSFVLSQIGFNAARGFVGGATTIGQFDEASVLFQCRTRLCGWCSFARTKSGLDGIRVSMPHAALWVVQRETAWKI